MEIINKLNVNFKELQTVRTNIINLLKNLDLRVEQLKAIYTELLISNSDNTTSTLDTFYFQNKLIKIELENNHQLFKIIDNRIYGDYYKLYRKVTKYILQNYNEQKIIKLCNNTTYPVYNDLDNTIDYDFTYTIEIYENIIEIFNQLNLDLQNKKEYLNMEYAKKNTGINIDNLLNSVKYNNTLLSEQITLFTNFMSVYNKFHIRYITRFNIKVKLFYGQITSDINLELDNNRLLINSIDTIYLDCNEEKYIRETIPDNKFSSYQDIIQNELDEILSGIRTPNNSEYDSSKEITDISKNYEYYLDNISNEYDIYEYSSDDNEYDINNKIYNLRKINKNNLLINNKSDNNNFNNDITTNPKYKCVIL